MQSYAEDGERVVEKRQLEALRAFPYNVVAQAIREMFVRGMLRQRTECGSAACKAQNDVCPHSKVCFVCSFSHHRKSLVIALSWHHVVP